MSSRKPNWTKWKLIPNTEVWKVVALTLNIDPDEVRRDGSDWMAGGEYVNHEGKAFDDMLDIIKANYSVIDNSPKTLTMNGIAFCELNISKFAKWALENNIDIPDEMKALATLQAASEKEMFDVNDSKYPRELHIAYMAWQAVSNMQNIKTSPKNKIKEWLDNKYSNNELPNEAKVRISTVANWNKTGGAPKSE